MRFELKTTPHPAINPDISAPLTDQEKHLLLVWAKVNSELDKERDCWLWQGALNSANNQARFGNQAAHAYIYKRLHNLAHLDPATLGRITHTCDNPQCVNPDHCKLSVGPRTIRKKRTEMNVDEKKVTDEVTREVNKEVVREIRALKSELLKEVGDAVVAELLRIKFDDHSGPGNRNKVTRREIKMGASKQVIIEKMEREDIREWLYESMMKRRRGRCGSREAF
jgi:hypothetical protein